MNEYSKGDHCLVNTQFQNLSSLYLLSLATIARKGKGRGRGAASNPFVRDSLVSEPSSEPVSEPEMADGGRIQLLEQRYESLSVGQEEIKNQMGELLRLLRAREETPGHQETPRRASTGDGSPGGASSAGSYVPKLAKLDFPRYDGSEDPITWICRVEQFFEYQDTPDDEKVKLASYHLDGDAQIWL